MPQDNAVMSEQPISDPPKRRRRRFQFRLGTAFIVMTTFCVWCWSEAHLASKRHQIIERLSPYGPKYPGIEVGASGITFYKGPSAPWPLNWFGEQGYWMISVPEDAPDEAITSIRQLFPEAEITRPASLRT
jgi:hypothetical protein